MKKIRRNIIMISCIMAMVVNLTHATYVAASEVGQSDFYDEMLINMGTPENVVENLDTNFKKYIYDNAESGEQFDGYTTEELNRNSYKINRIAKYSSNLSESDMTVSIYATGVVKNGIKYVKIYPSFCWKKSVSISNDTFALSLYSGWECKGNDNVELVVSAVCGTGAIQQKHTFKPTDAAESGYAFQIPNDYGKQLPGNGHYEGYGHFLVRRKKSKATKSISVKYIHDDSSNYSVSYGISIGPASISVSGDTDKLQIFAKNINFSYSYSTK